MAARPTRTGVPRIAATTIDRLEIFNRLNTFAPVTFLRGPKGFGKTTTVARWLRRHPPADTAVVWVQLSDDARSAEDLWQKLANELTKRGIDTGRGNEHDIAYAIGGHASFVLIIVDAADRLDNDAPIARLLHLAQEHDHFSLVFTARRKLAPDVHVDQLMTSISIDADDLAFNGDETREIFETVGASDRTSVISQLHTELGGWPLLIHRAALLLAEAEQPNLPVRTVVDRIIADIWSMVTGDHIESGLVEFAVNLAHASHLDRETMVLIAKAIDGAADPWLLIDQVERLGWAISSSGTQTGWQLVPAIRDLFISAGAARAVSVEAVQRMLIDHHAGKGQWHHALDQAVHFNDSAVLTTLIESGWMWMLLHSKEKLHHAINELPAGLLDENPVVRGILEQLERIEAGSTHTETFLDETFDFSGDDAARRVYDALAIMGGLRSSGRISQAARFATSLNTALVTVFDDATLRREAADDAETVSAVLALMMHIGFSWQLNDQISDALAIFKTVERHADLASVTDIPRDVQGSLAAHYAVDGKMRRAQMWADKEAEHPPMNSWFERRLATAGNLARAWIALEQFDIGQFQQSLTPLAEQRYDDEFWFQIVQLQAIDEILWGKPELMLAEMNQLQNEFAHLAPPGSTADVALRAVHIDLRMAAGHGNRLLTLLDDAESSHPAFQIRRARFAALINDWPEILRIVLPAEQTTTRQRLELTLLYALAYQQRGDEQTARQYLGTALRRLERQGLRMPITALARRHVEELLPHAEPYGAYLKDQLDTLVQWPIPDTVEVIQLTDGEQLVVDGLSRGLAVKAIAASAHLSVNTVKTHNRTLYRKLGVSARDEAVLRSRKLGLGSAV